VLGYKRRQQYIAWGTAVSIQHLIHDLHDSVLHLHFTVDHRGLQSNQPGRIWTDGAPPPRGRGWEGVLVICYINCVINYHYNMCVDGDVRFSSSQHVSPRTDTG